MWRGGKGLIILNHLNTELNPICHLLALLRAHHILHVSRIRVKLSTTLTITLLPGKGFSMPVGQEAG
jgi:hypothetical protein